MTKHLRFLCIAISFTVFTACGGGTKEKDGTADTGGDQPAGNEGNIKPEPSPADAFLKDIDAKAALELVGKKSALQVLDVRTPEEFAAGHLEGAVNIDFKADSFKEELAKLPRDKAYLLHCRSGRRSNAAKPALEELGFKFIYHMDGGYLAWEEAGGSTVKP